MASTESLRAMTPGQVEEAETLTLSNRWPCVYESNVQEYARRNARGEAIFADGLTRDQFGFDARCWPWARRPACWAWPSAWPGPAC